MIAQSSVTNGLFMKTATTATAAKVKACHHPLQVSDIAVQVHAAL